MHGDISHGGSDARDVPDEAGRGLKAFEPLSTFVGICALLVVWETIAARRGNSANKVSRRMVANLVTK